MFDIISVATNMFCMLFQFGFVFVIDLSFVRQ